MTDRRSVGEVPKYVVFHDIATFFLARATYLVTLPSREKQLASNARRDILGTFFTLQF